MPEDRGNIYCLISIRVVCSKHDQTGTIHRVQLAKIILFELIVKRN